MTTTIFYGGDILSCDDKHTAVEAIAIKGSKVLYVGSLGSVEDRAGKGSRKIDLAGATLMPGLIDTHPHLMHFGLFDEFAADLSDAVDHDDIVKRLQKRAKGTKKGQWVLGSPIGDAHYFQKRSWRDLQEGELPDRHVLDRVSDKHPVMILAYAPTTPAYVTMNSAALSLLGFTSSTPNQVGKVWIAKDSDGEPTGRISGSVNTYYNNEPFWDEVLAKVLKPTLKIAVSATKKSMKAYHALGVTTVYEGHAMSMQQIAGYKLMHKLGMLTMRVLVCPEAEPYGTIWDKPLSDKAFDKQLRKAASMVSRNNDMLRVDGVTIGRGGPCEPGFILMREPYKGPYGDMTKGISFMSKKRAERAIDFCLEHDLRLNIVTAGTQEHDDYLDYFDTLKKTKLDANGRAWILQHIYFMEEEQARRMGAYGFDVTTSHSFTWGEGDLFRERIGEDCVKDLIPIKRLMNYGMHVACGSDWGPKNIFKHMALAIEPRFARSGKKNAGVAQVIDREESLATWTREAAHVLRWEGIGTLKEGNHADITIVDRNPLTCPLEKLGDTVVHATLIGGKCVHGESFLAAKGWLNKKTRFWTNFFGD